MKTFYFLLANTLIATVTNMTVWFAIIFYVFLQTNSVFATAIMSGIFTTITALTGFWFGSIVDHNKKKHVLLGSSTISLIVYLITFSIYLMVDKSSFFQITNPMMWGFIILLLIGVIAGNIRGITLSTLVTLLVPDDKRDKANGLVGTTMGVSFLVTSVISGILVGNSGLLLVLGGAAMLMALTLIHILMIDIQETKTLDTHENTTKKLDIAGTIKVIQAIPGLFPLIFFTMFNNFLGGVFMSLMDAYGLSMVSVQVWGLLWGFLSSAFILGGLLIAKFGLGKNPLRSMMLANLVIWSVCCVFTIQPSLIFLAIGSYLYLSIFPFIEASEQTIIQKVVPKDRQGRVFGFAQSIEQSASPLMSFAIGPITQFFFIPFMTTGAGVELIGGWFGTGPARGIALVFTVAGLVGLCATILAFNSKAYKMLSATYLHQ